MKPPSSRWSRKHKWIYDVFVSFRGEDTRYNFVSHLSHALRQASIEIFVDDRLERGNEISSSLRNAIEGSRIAVVVFSENYAASRWCMEELVQIMECCRNLGQVVLPIFYNVDPSDVRHQKGTFGEVMKRHQRRSGVTRDRVLMWRTALTDAANLSGWDTRTSRYEFELIKEIVGVILKMLDTQHLFVTEHLVGIKPRTEELKLLMEERSEDVLIIGILGMGGIGKTTIAKAFYNDIVDFFEGRSFLEDIREVSKQSGSIVCFQKQLISNITGIHINIHSIGMGKNILMNRLCHTRALIVLDNVDKLDQLMALCGSRKWFGPKSVIIITTRDEGLLRVIQADHIYRVMEMTRSESLELLSWHAFKQYFPPQGFFELSRRVIAYCGGLPLALEVLGSYLFEKSEEEWEFILSKLERIPNGQIQAKLQISFDDLDDIEKDAFLDICCFFNGKNRGYVTQVLDGCGYFATTVINVLLDRSLLKVFSNNKLGMHDLVRDMGREIIRAEYPKELERRSRLWFHEDAFDVLTEGNGTRAIEGLALKLPSNQRESLSTEAFRGMKRLRLLQLDNLNLDGEYKYISTHLRWLCWHNSALKCIPDDFYQKNIVAIDLKYSHLKLVWKEGQLLERLKILNLSHSCYITQTPNFTMIPSLEKLILKDCPSLVIVHESIGDLKNLLLVNLKDCKCLRHLPRSIYKLKSLKDLILSGCSMLDRLEEDIEQMESLRTLMADNTSIIQVPHSLVRSRSISYISVGDHEGRSQDIFPSLVWSWMSPTVNIPQSHIEAFLARTSSLVSFSVKNYIIGLSHIPCSISMLRRIWEECRPTFRLNGNIIGVLDALCSTNFTELESILKASQISDVEASRSKDGHNQLQIAWPIDSFNSLIIPMGVCNKKDILNITQEGNFQYPGCFMYKGEGCSVFFKVPHFSRSFLKAMVLKTSYSSCTSNTASEFLTNVWVNNYTKLYFLHHKGDSETWYEDEKWQGIISTFEPGDAVEVLVNFGGQFTVKKVVAYLVYEE